MILSDRTIQTLLENGTLRISPLGPGQIQRPVWTFALVTRSA